MMKSDELIFILDIGTRSVIGIVGRAQDEMLEVLGVETIEHSSRAVVDGQIEDIERTAKVASQVKDRLEAKLGVRLHEVHVAAAGRVLRTERVVCEMTLGGSDPIGQAEMRKLETAAIQKAYETLANDPEGGTAADFCSVGHSVVGYELDGYTFSTLVGHRGRDARVEMIATFLPNEVVESLYTTMSMLGLSIASMTLEPIAAMSAVVPKELHLLNIALVDVGAGTSDIAVTDKGSICGYTMATVAGDEITECVMREFLVDFGMAERMKFAASAGVESIDYEDVLGLSDQVERAELLERIRPSVEDLAKRVAEGILAINGASPKAVFMVGGGSRTPGLCERVAEALSIDAKRVAIGGSNYMKRQASAEEAYLSAEYATPIGIALTAMQTSGGEGLTVSLNGNRLQLLGSSMTVMEALRKGGFQYGQIMGRSGKSVVFELNGERKIVRGGLHTLAEIQVNGVLAGLSTLLQAGDEITFVPAEDGKDAAPSLQEVADRWQPFEVEFLGRMVPAGTRGLVNGASVDGDWPIQAMDQVVVEQIDTLGALLESLGFDGMKTELSINGEPCSDLSHPLHAGDRITPRGSTAVQRATEEKSPPAPSDDRSPIGRGLTIHLNGRDWTLAPRPDREPYQLFHLLAYVDVDPRDPHGEIILVRNGDPASYLDPIEEGDRIEIHWSEEEASARMPHRPEKL